MLKPVTHDVWEYERHLKMAGLLKFPRRSTVVRLSDGSLWVHNVNALDTAGVQDAIDALGPVRHIVAPNKFHHFWVDRWKTDYPDATVYAARGLAKKRPGLPFDVTLEETAPAEWNDAFDMLQTEGHPALREVVFFHRASRTLILTDWVFNIGPHESAPTRLLFRLNGCYCQLKPSRLFRSFAKDKARIRKTVDEICDRWDFQRIVMAHGMIADAGPAELRAAYADF